MTKLTFCGAARQVTGSMYLLETGSNETYDRFNILIDCGQDMEHRPDFDKELPQNTFFPFDPSEINLVLLTHAHIDHSGYLPLLYKEGFDGQILCTKSTAELTDILLRDSASINAKKAKGIEGSKKKSKKKKFIDARTLFFERQVKEAVSNIVTIPFNQKFKIADGIFVTFVPAGHLLGAAHLVVEVKVNNETKKIGFSGDIGRKDYPLLINPEPLPQVDYLLCETTYGERHHQHDLKPEDYLAEIIQKACIDISGRIIVPAFSVGRTQSMLFALHKLFVERGFPPIKVFTDSPMGAESTKVYEKSVSLMNNEAKEFKAKHGSLFDFENFEYVESLKASKAVSNHSEPCIIISASGMIQGGRIEYHIEQNISNPYATILLVGFASEGTLGWDLVHGNRETLTINNKKMPILANIQKIDVFSGHGDQTDLLNFVRNQDKTKLKKVFLIHGEVKSMETFKELLNFEGYENVEIPNKGQTYIL
jgi:metallo-beta-lactamase family protein